MAQRPSWDPWHEVRRLQRDFQHLFERGNVAATDEYPPINITHTSEGLVFLEALCPGADKETLEVTVGGDTLTIKGERKAESDGDDARYHRRQRVTGRFARTVRLPERIDAEQVQATYAHGILLLQLTPVPASTPRRITIRS